MAKQYMASSYSEVFSLVDQFLKQNMTGGDGIDFGDDLTSFGRALVQHDDSQLWQKLYFDHWPTLFGFYNISLLGR